DCRLLSSTLVWRTDKARLPDRPARRQSRRDARGICSVEPGSARPRAKPPLLRRSGDVAVRGRDSMGRINRPSSGYRGDTVLTQGSGGVSVFALQFARLLGARVIATTSAREKVERLKALGASDVINYSETPDWDAKVRELTDGRGVDCVVEI